MLDLSVKKASRQYLLQSKLIHNPTYSRVMHLKAFYITGFGKNNPNSDNDIAYSVFKVLPTQSRWANVRSGNC